MDQAFLHELAGGTVGGALGVTLVYPLDTAKCLMQTNGGRFTSTLSGMVGKEGLLSLYRGLLSPVAGYGALFAISFSAYGQAGRWLRERRQQRTVVGNGNAPADAPLTFQEMMLAGGFAGACQSPLRQVFERVKTVMQVQRGPQGRAPYSWTGQCALQLVQRQGLKAGLFRGNAATLLREVKPVSELSPPNGNGLSMPSRCLQIPQFAVYYPAYEISKGFFQGVFHGEGAPGATGVPGRPSTLATVCAGAVAGVIQWLPPIYCIDVLKTRLQAASPASSVESPRLLSSARTLYRMEGAAVVFRGLWPSLL
ncbi:unnamed protein product, partial [Chrysoparadoxa australica]